MIKVQDNTATRTPIPDFLRGLEPESLADLTWTDPQLGVSDAAWWPEVDVSPALAQYERYGAETLTPDAATKTVTVNRAVAPWSAEEIATDVLAHAPSHRITRLAFRNRFTTAEKVALEIAGLDNPAAPMPARAQAAALRANQADLASATFVDLQRADTRAGVQMLETAGLLAAGRALEILDGPIQPSERPL